MHTALLNTIASRLLIVTTLLATLLLGALLAVTPTKATPSEPFLVKPVGRCEKAQTLAVGERYFNPCVPLHLREWGYGIMSRKD
ncbi:hypothetical protein EYB53_021310 [Candidatus Chloroploca sp. M-50]|uniref:Uncharacterized protein n=1 Tax=Candidatus Chloroploca mongolica TaxID=2528176 RepID=A0ABS4DFP9_9CHLR|nr:hypothetical protein [Candidatus Chloroploca mongolica]MBP1468263.1 hypothetical protein [Candidatus Chloroploca mongolica]